MKAWKFVLVLLVVCAQARATEAEDKRLVILKAERKAVQTELVGVVNEWTKAPEKDKAALAKRRDSLVLDLKALDTEIQSTGKMPKITVHNDGEGASQEKQEKKVVPVTRVEAVEKSEKRWDVFKNF